MEAPQMRGVEEPLLPEPRAVEGGATQSEGAIETQERRYPRLHKTAGFRGLDVWAEISKGSPGRTFLQSSRLLMVGRMLAHIDYLEESIGDLSSQIERGMRPFFG